MTPEDFQAKKRAYEDNLAKAHELLKKNPEGYSAEGYDLRKLMDEIEEYEEAQKNFRRELVRWKWRTE